MTIATSGGGAGGAGAALERQGSATSLADVVETVLDKGVVIDAQVSVAVVGIQLLEVNARVVIAGVETYLRFAEAVDRLDITPKNQKGLPDLVEGASGVGSAVAGVGRTVGAIGGAVKDAVSGDDDRGGQRVRQRRRDRGG